MATLRVHVDFLSPYAYLAWTQLPALAARHDRTLEVVPVLFPAMLDAFGTVGPAEVPTKRLYTFKDVVRKARRLGVPLVVPPVHPFLPLLPLRISTAATDRVAVVDALFQAVWGRGRPIDTPDAARAVLVEAGLDAGLVERAVEPAVKAALAVATRGAIEQGIFGVPTIVADGEPFWGLDSLPLLETFLRGEDPITPELLAEVERIPVGVTRKR